MPTKTRLDPTAGGATPPAEPERAHGSGRGDDSSSARAGQTSAGDVTGFIDSLTALAAHLEERETFEATTRRAWTRMAFYSTLLIPLPVFLNAFATAYIGNAASARSNLIALVGAGALTAGLATMLFLAAASAPWRTSPDSVDRVALRHEDSPLRDRIRISQWILFDAAFARFAFHERRVNAVIAQGVMATSSMAVLCVALVIPLELMIGAASVAPGYGPSVSLVLFLVLVVATILGVSKAAKGEFHLAQHYGRQVLAFDIDFGGFMPRSEKERVEKIVNVKTGGAEPAPPE